MSPIGHVLNTCPPVGGLIWGCGRTSRWQILEMMAVGLRCRKALEASSLAPGLPWCEQLLPLAPTAAHETLYCVLFIRMDRNLQIMGQNEPFFPSCQIFLGLVMQI